MNKLSKLTDVFVHKKYSIVQKLYKRRNSQSCEINKAWLAEYLNIFYNLSL